MSPLVSIVIPTYNRALELQRAIQAVIAQTYSHWEILVIDNHSNDTTDEVIAGFKDSKIKLFKIHNHGVIAASRNVGIKNAQGQYIAFLDSDDWWLENKLEESVKYLEQGADVVYHNLQCIKKTNQKFYMKKTRCRDLKKPVFNDLICNGNVLTNSSVVLRTELLHSMGGLSEDPELIAAEDYECWLRVSKLTDRFVFIPKVLGCYWIGGDNESNPNRSVVYLKRLHALYILNFIKETNIDVPFWWTYSLGRACYLIGEYSQAKSLLQTLVRRPLPMMIQLKVFFMLLRMLFNTTR